MLVVPPCFRGIGTLEGVAAFPFHEGYQRRAPTAGCAAVVVAMGEK